MYIYIYIYWKNRFFKNALAHVPLSVGVRGGAGLVLCIGFPHAGCGDAAGHMQVVAMLLE